MILPKAPITAKDRGRTVPEGRTNNCTVKSSEEEGEGVEGARENQKEFNLKYDR